MMTNQGGTPDYDLLAPLDTDAAVIARVERILSEEEWSDQSLWLLFLSPDAVQLPVVVPIDGVPAWPDPGAAEDLCHMTAHVLADAAPGGSLVVTMMRDHRPGGDESDQRWLEVLTAAAPQAGVRVRMICVATPDGVRRLGDGAC